MREIPPSTSRVRFGSFKLLNLKIAAGLTSDLCSGLRGVRRPIAKVNELGTYKVYGSETLENGGDWQYPTNALHRFFKVKVEMP